MRGGAKKEREGGYGCFWQFYRNKQMSSRGKTSYVIFILPLKQAFRSSRSRASDPCPLLNFCSEYSIASYNNKIGLGILWFV